MVHEGTCTKMYGLMGMSGFGVYTGQENSGTGKGDGFFFEFDQDLRFGPPFLLVEGL